jgi:hypothetical protein
MAREILIVFDIIKLLDGKLAIVLNAGRKELRSQWVNLSKKGLKAQFEGKKIQVISEGFQFETNVLEVEILNSIEDFKMVGLKLDNNPFTQKIKINDEVEVDL